MVDLLLGQRLVHRPQISQRHRCDEELAFRFAGLGVKAIALANELRKTVGLPADKFSTKDGDDWLAEQIRDIEAIRSKRARVQSELTNSLNKQTEPPQSSRR